LKVAIPRKPELPVKVSSFGEYSKEEIQSGGIS
jgi:hypothetical protein